MRRPSIREKDYWILNHWFLFGLPVSSGRFLEVKENKREDDNADHHGEGGGVVRVRTADEALVLGVFQRTHGHLKKGRNLKQIMLHLILI
jgi:hypothetical protein